MKAVYLLLVLLTLTHAFAVNNTEATPVEVQGIGTDAESAEKSALQSAIQQAVGSYLNQETIVENEQLIRDKIYNITQGFVERYDVLSPAHSRSSDGLWEIRLRVYVKKSNVGAALRNAGVTEVAVEGHSVWAQNITHVKNREDAMALLEKLIPEIPKNLGSVKLADNSATFQTAEDPKTGKINVIVNIQYSINIRWWKSEAYPALEAALSALQLQNSPGAPESFTAQNAGDGFAINWQSQRIKGTLRDNAIKIFTPTNPTMNTWTASRYILPSVYATKVSQLLHSHFNPLRFTTAYGRSTLFTVRFLDDAGICQFTNDVTSDQLGFAFGEVAPSDTDDVYLMPVFYEFRKNSRNEEVLIYSTKPITARYLVDVPVETLKLIKRVELKAGTFGIPSQIDSISQQTVSNAPTRIGDSTPNLQCVYRVIGIPKNDKLNMRSGPGASYPTIVALPYNACGIILIPETQVNGETTWQRIQYQDQTGWVNLEFLKALPQKGAMKMTDPILPQLTRAVQAIGQAVGQAVEKTDRYSGPVRVAPNQNPNAQSSFNGENSEPVRIAPNQNPNATTNLP